MMIVARSNWRGVAVNLFIWKRREGAKEVSLLLKELWYFKGNFQEKNSSQNCD